MITIEELALAYELRGEGCCWKRIAQGLGCDWRALMDQVRNVCNGGIEGLHVQAMKRKIPEWAVEAAALMRSHNLGWRSISDYLGIDRDRLKWATQRRRLKQISRSTKAPA